MYQLKGKDKMNNYFEDLASYKKHTPNLKNATVTAEQLLPAIVSHMQRMDRKFSLHVNGRLPKPLHELLEDVFNQCHLMQPFFTQHCSYRHYRYKAVSKNKIKIEFTMQYRLTREEEKWVLAEIDRVLAAIITPTMNDFQKILAVHDYIIRHYHYELNTDGSPFAVYTFMHEKRGVCMAYALLFEKMMEQLAIPCYYVVGKAEGESDAGHAWNMVQLNGHWYHIDATWNDLGSRTTNHAIRYRYFLRDDDFMKKDHIWNFAHYPICKDTTYAAISSLYDVALVGDAMYFPHPKTAHLTKIDTSTAKLAMQTVLDGQVQYCTAFQHTLYISHFGHGASLYRYAAEEKAFHVIEKRPVASIYATLDELTVTYQDGQTYTEKVEVAHEAIVLAPYETAVLAHFGTTWFGQYTRSAADAFVRFEDGHGVTLTLQESIASCTVDILFEHTLLIDIRAKRKAIRLTAPATLTIPHDVLSIPAETPIVIDGATAVRQTTADATIIQLLPIH